MIPGSFAYHRPSIRDEAVGLLAQLGDDGRAACRRPQSVTDDEAALRRAGHLIDLGGIAELKGIREDGDDIGIGAMTTENELIWSELLQQNARSCRDRAQISDPQVRYRGTLGGNFANGDPGNDMPALMHVPRRLLSCRRQGGERAVAAREFFHGAYFTALEPGEILTEIRIPLPPAGHGYGYEKLKRKIGDFATAAAAVCCA